jgi:hypothetical protein
MIQSLATTLFVGVLHGKYRRAYKDVSITHTCARAHMHDCMDTAEMCLSHIMKYIE